MQKKKKFYHRLESEAKKINKDVEFYHYLKLINIFEQTALDARFY